MQPIKGSQAVIQHPLTPTDAPHEFTIVPKNNDAVGVITKYLEDNRIPSNVVAGGAIKVQGSLDYLGHLLGVKTGLTPHGHFSYHGELRVDDVIHQYVTAILGMDTHPVAKPHFRKNNRHFVDHHSGLKPLTISQVARGYQFPDTAKYRGAGQCIDFIELGGGYVQSDLDTFFKAAHFNPHPIVSSVSVDGAVNSPGVSDADGEVALDVEVGLCVAPSASAKVFFAPNTDAGFYNAIQAAIIDPKVTVISISWGGPENGWTGQAVSAMNQALLSAIGRKSVLVAAGDNGCDDGVGDGQYHVDFPGSSPYSLCCGGTSLQLNAQGGIALETVWNETPSQEGATGGGVSSLFKNRNVPDFSGNADPLSGYEIFYGGQWSIVGGTSAVAPLYAGLFAQLGSAKGSKGAPFLFDRIKLHNPALFRDVTLGTNSISHHLPLYVAQKGYDCCTGFGVPNGKAFLELALAE